MLNDKTAVVIGCTENIEKDVVLHVDGYTITAINVGAFLKCDSLEEIVIPEGVTTIESRTFNGCNSLKTIIISKSVEVIHSNAIPANTTVYAEAASKPSGWHEYRCGGNDGNVVWNYSATE